MGQVGRPSSTTPRAGPCGSTRTAEPSGATGGGRTHRPARRQARRKRHPRRQEQPQLQADGGVQLRLPANQRQPPPGPGRHQRHGASRPEPARAGASRLRRRRPVVAHRPGQRPAKPSRSEGRANPHPAQRAERHAQQRQHLQALQRQRRHRRHQPRPAHAASTRGWLRRHRHGHHARRGRGRHHLHRRGLDGRGLSQLWPDHGRRRQHPGWQRQRGRRLGAGRHGCEYRRPGPGRQRRHRCRGRRRGLHRQPGGRHGHRQRRGLQLEGRGAKRRGRCPQRRAGLRCKVHPPCCKAPRSRPPSPTP